MLRFLKMIILGVLPLLSCKDDTLTPSGPNDNGPYSLIAFTSEVNGNPQVFTMYPDGTNIVQNKFRYHCQGPEGFRVCGLSHRSGYISWRRQQYLCACSGGRYGDALR